MKNKRLFLILSLGLLAAAVQAQTRFGFRAGLQLADVHYSGRSDPFYYTAILQSKTKPRLTFLAGAVAEREISRFLTISAEVQAGGRGYSLEPQDSFADFTTYRTLFWFIQVPLTCSVRWRGFFAGAGPYFGLGIGGKLKSTLYDPIDNTTQRFEYPAQFGDEQSKHFRRYDAGLYFQAGYSFRNVRLIFAYQLGLNDIIPGVYGYTGSSAQHRCASLSAAYFLGAGE